MNCLCRIKSACSRWGGIYLVDKCLMIILALLMFQSAISLFLYEGTGPESEGIDVMVRTSASGIFGYLISANFNQHRKHACAGRSQRGKAPAELNNQGSEQIGFHAGLAVTGGGAALAAPPTVTQEDITEQNCDRAQILVVAAIGLSSLLVLLIFRNFMERTAVNTGSLTQFRDFVSGSVGFLISCSTGGVNQRKEN